MLLGKLALAIAISLVGSVKLSEPVCFPDKWCMDRAPASQGESRARLLLKDEVNRALLEVSCIAHRDIGVRWGIALHREAGLGVSGNILTPVHVAISVAVPTRWSVFQPEFMLATEQTWGAPNAGPALTTILLNGDLNTVTVAASTGLASFSFSVASLHTRMGAAQKWCDDKK